MKREGISRDADIYTSLYWLQPQSMLEKNNREKNSNKMCHLGRKRNLLQPLHLRKHTNWAWSLLGENDADKQWEGLLCSGKHLKPGIDATESNDLAKCDGGDAVWELYSLHLPPIPDRDQATLTKYTGEDSSTHKPTWKIMRAAGVFSPFMDGPSGSFGSYTEWTQERNCSCSFTGVGESFPLFFSDENIAKSPT